MAAEPGRDAGGPLSEGRPSALPPSAGAVPIRGADAAVRRRRARGEAGQADIAGGTIADDFDGDGLVDVFFTSVDYCAPVRLFRNRGDGTFEDRTAAAGLMEQLGGINAVQTDYNNDGRLDIFVMRGGWESSMRNSLLRNDGTAPSPTSPPRPGCSMARQATHSVAWADFDNDGWLDVFVAHELTPSQLFRNRRDGTFEDVTARAGVGATAFTKGVVAGDFDGNGYPDLYLSNMFGDNILFRNNGDGTFADATARARRRQAVRQLSHLVLRLRQRRPARSVRRRPIRTRSRSS